MSMCACVEAYGNGKMELGPYRQRKGNSRQGVSIDLSPESYQCQGWTCVWTSTPSPHEFAHCELRSEPWGWWGTSMMLGNGWLIRGRQKNMDYTHKPWVLKWVAEI